MTLPDEFYVTLVSDECSEYFPNNEKTAFTNKLSAPILFDKQYCVALTEIYIPPFSLKNVSLAEEERKSIEIDPDHFINDYMLLQHQKPSWVPLSIHETQNPLNPSSEKRIKLNHNFNDHSSLQRDETTQTNNIDDSYNSNSTLMSSPNTSDQLPLNIVEASKSPPNVDSIDQLVPPPNVDVKPSKSPSKVDEVEKAPLNVDNNEQVVSPPRVDVDPSKSPSSVDEASLSNVNNTQQVASSSKVDVEPPKSPPKVDEPSPPPNVNQHSKVIESSKKVIDAKKLIERASQTQSSSSTSNTHEKVDKQSKSTSKKNQNDSKSRTKSKKNNTEQQKTDSQKKDSLSHEEKILDSIIKKKTERFGAIPTGSLQIPVNIFNWDIVIPPDDIQKLSEISTGVPSTSLTSLLLAGLTFANDDQDLQKTNQYGQIEGKMDDFLNEIMMHTEWKSVDMYTYNNFFTLNVPIDVDDINSENPKFSYRKVFVPVQPYTGLGSFFSEIFSQIPPMERKPFLFFKSLNFDKNVNKPDSVLWKSRPEVVNFFKNNVSPVLKNLEMDSTGSNIKKRSLDTTSSLQNRRTAKEYVHMLYVYSDIVAGHAYADQNLEVLRIIPGYTRHVALRGLYTKFSNPEFYPVNKTYFDTISIKINNREDELEFSEENFEPVYIQLKFKKM